MMEQVPQTPMMQQYFKIRDAYPDSLLFFRLGEFYELFYDDAIVASKALDITLTKRGKHGENEIPMCGIPVHSYDNYLPKLIKNGFKVAICEQMETPEEAKKRGNKAIVERDVTRIVTPGTLTEEHLLDKKSNNFLACVFERNDCCALAWADISTGDFSITSFPKNRLFEELSNLSPSEIIISDKQYSRDMKREFVWSTLPHLKFDFFSCSKRLLEVFDLLAIDSLGAFTQEEVITLGALSEYLFLTQKHKNFSLNKPKKISTSKNLEIDFSTRKSLEIFSSLNGNYEGSLLSIIDQTLTASGGRLLREYMLFPSCDVVLINQRLDMVEYFYYHETKEILQKTLSLFPDVERALSKIAYDRAAPRDLKSILEGLRISSDIIECLKNAPHRIEVLKQNLEGFDEVTFTLEKALSLDVPLFARDGGFIKSGYDLELDEYRKLKNEGTIFVENLQENYVQETQIPSLKIKHNNILGFFIEVTSVHLSKVPNTFIHRQTIVNGARYTTAELIDLEKKILEANEKALTLELEIFKVLCQLIIQNQEKIKAYAKAVAEIDVFFSFALLSLKNNYTKPDVDDSLQFHIEKGRHPVVEVYLSKEQQQFTPNDSVLEGARRIWLLTGPNMAGKSTFLRQNALIAYMAQLGCFVPAEKASIGVVDRIFSRVGASDDLAKGRSTFMVEMVETAAILNQATPRSLVILDEIGRGTSTYDGLSIAWATLEYLEYANQSRGIFATHYHELTDLCKQLKHLSPYTMEITEWEGKIIFRHSVKPGSVNKSYGVHVAELAGLPKIVVSRANQILKQFNRAPKEKTAQEKILDIPSPITFDIKEEREVSRLEEEIKTIDLDNISPKNALDVLYKLRKMIN